MWRPDLTVECPPCYGLNTATRLAQALPGGAFESVQLCSEHLLLVPTFPTQSSCLLHLLSQSVCGAWKSASLSSLLVCLMDAADANVFAEFGSNQGHMVHPCQLS